MQRKINQNFLDALTDVASPFMRVDGSREEVIAVSLSIIEEGAQRVCTVDFDRLDHAVESIPHVIRQLPQPFQPESISVSVTTAHIIYGGDPKKPADEPVKAEKPSLGESLQKLVGIFGRAGNVVLENRERLAYLRSPEAETEYRARQAAGLEPVGPILMPALEVPALNHYAKHTGDMLPKETFDRWCLEIPSLAREYNRLLTEMVGKTMG